MSSPSAADSVAPGELEGVLPALDTHVHLWRFVASEHPWMTPAMDMLKRDFLAEQLQAHLHENHVRGAIAVQARSSLDETRWLLGLAERHSFIAGVVGWVPLTAPDLARHLDALAPHPALLGVRHVGVDDPDDELLLRPDFDRGIAALAKYDLAYDIIIRERHLPQALKLVDRHPRQTFVLDHMARPEISREPSAPWQSHLRLLAERPNVYCKLSGLTTGADWQRWDTEDLRPYTDLVLEAFGPRRLMFGSDWPMCLLSCEYRKWTETVQALTAALSPDERAWLWCQTAQHAYRVYPRPSPAR
ncbi:amidohydrolase family protein [Nannocystis pusilla]|uniref:amidohydrolase family protein n=1 Tax=Nannocystis pusilla TaxID=889268 RepID=UPI003DA3C6FE